MTSLQMITIPANIQRSFTLLFVSKFYRAMEREFIQREFELKTEAEMAFEKLEVTGNQLSMLLFKYKEQMIYSKDIQNVRLSFTAEQVVNILKDRSH